MESGVYEVPVELLSGWTGPIFYRDRKPLLLDGEEIPPTWCPAVFHEGKIFDLGRDSDGTGMSPLLFRVGVDIAVGQVRDHLARVTTRVSTEPTLAAGAIAYLAPEEDPTQLGWPLGFWLGPLFFPALNEEEWVDWEEHLGPDCVRCPELADLNPEDESRFPDGSLRVDGIALIRVALAVHETRKGNTIEEEI